MTLSDWAALAVICLVGASSPGPSLIVILAVTRRYGKNAGLLAAFGHGMGVFFYALLAATTLSFVISRYQSVFTTIQIAGAGLLIWIGFQLLRAALRPQTENLDSDADTNTLKRSFRDGLAIALFNPKILAFFTSLFSQFIHPEQIFITHLAMAGLAGFIDSGIYVFMVLLASMHASKTLLERYQRPIDVSFAILLLGLGFSLLFRLINPLL